MRIPAYRLAIFAVVTCHALPAAAQVDQQRAQEYFKEARALCERDGGRLWGRVGVRTDGDCGNQESRAISLSAKRSRSGRPGA